jgi:hypothetical protein
VKSLITKYEPQYFEKVMKQTRKRLTDDPSSYLYEQSPCGKYMGEWMEMTMADAYKSKFNDNEEDDANRKKALLSSFNNFITCMDTKANENLKYWHFVKSVAEQNIADQSERTNEKQVREKKEKSKEKSKTEKDSPKPRNDKIMTSDSITQPATST